MTKTLPEFREKFGLEELTITTTEHWTWSVRPLQPTLGCTVLSLNRLCPTFGEMTEQEALDFGRVVRLVEARVGEAWAPDRFNYLMYMLDRKSVV